MSDSTLFNELEQKIVGLVNALKAEREKNKKNTDSVIESQKLSKIEELSLIHISEPTRPY